MMHKKILTAVLLGGLSMMTVKAQQASFQGLGDASVGGLSAWAISGDGATLGGGGRDENGWQPAIWTANVIQRVPLLPGSTRGEVTTPFLPLSDPRKGVLKCLTPKGNS